MTGEQGQQEPMSRWAGPSMNGNKKRLYPKTPMLGLRRPNRLGPKYSQVQPLPKPPNLSEPVSSLQKSLESFPALLRLSTLVKLHMLTTRLCDSSVSSNTVSYSFCTPEPQFTDCKDASAVVHLLAPMFKFGSGYRPFLAQICPNLDSSRMPWCKRRSLKGISARAEPRLEA